MFDDEYVSLLKEAGCLGVLLTVDSDTVQETFSLFKTLADLSAVIINFGLRIARGSEIETLTKEKGLIASDDDLYLSKDFNAEVLEYVFSECRTNPGWLTFSRIDQFLFKNLFAHFQSFIPKPEWQQTKTLSRLMKPLRKPVLFNYLRV